MGVEDLQAAEVYAKHAGEVTQFATGLVGPSDAADVVSAAVLGCLQSDRWPNVADPRAYLFRAVLNQARMQHRSTRRRIDRERRSVFGRGSSQLQERSDVADALDRLSVRQRAVIVLTYWDDLEPGSIAELLGISEGSVRRHLARGRAHLREILG